MSLLGKGERSLNDGSCDIRTVLSNSLIVLCWKLFDKPVEIYQWLDDLDARDFTIVRTPYTLSEWLSVVDGLLAVLNFDEPIPVASP